MQNIKNVFFFAPICPKLPFFTLTLGQIKPKRAKLSQNCYTLHVRNVDRRIVPSLENSSNILYNGTPLVVYLSY